MKKDSTKKPQDLKQAVLKKIEEEKKEFAQSETNHDSFSENELNKSMKSQQDGDAWLFTQLYRNKLVYDHTENTWMIFIDHYWDEDCTNEALTKIDAVIDEYSKQAAQSARKAGLAAKIPDEKEVRRYTLLQSQYLRKISKLQLIKWKNDVLKLASAGKRALGVAGDEWDLYPLLLTCVNGVLDLQTGRFSDGKPQDYIKSFCPTPWEGFDKECPTWIKFLSDIFDGNEELISFIHRLLGYSITGLTIEHIFPICWGKGRNGKGTLFELLKYVLGAHLSGPIESEMLLAQNQAKLSNAPSPDIMNLKGKRLVWASETNEGRKLNIGKVKLLVGGDTLSGRNCYGKQTSFTPTHKLFLMTNHKPRVDPTDCALWERVFLIPFTVSFIDNPQSDGERKKDKFLLEKLKKETPGILTWLVKGCIAWRNHGLNPPECVKEATNQYKTSEDDFTQFISECCIVNESAMVRAGIVRTAYEQYCAALGIRPLGPRKFSERMQNRFERLPRDAHGFSYMGLGLLEKNEEE